MNLKLLAAGAVAASALIGTASASAAATVDSVTAYAHGRDAVEIDVNTLRGTATVAPRVTVRSGTRAAELRTVGWDAAAAPTDLTLSEGRLVLRSAVAAGDALTLSVRVCDDDCVTQDVVVTVAGGVPGGPGRGEDHGRGEHGDDGECEHGDAPPAPDGAVTSDVAVANALAANPGATLLRVHLAHTDAAVWEVELTAADGTTTLEVLVAADGSIVSTETGGASPAASSKAKASAKAKAAARARARAKARARARAKAKAAARARLALRAQR